MKQIDKIKQMNVEEIYKWIDDNVRFCFSSLEGYHDCPFVPFCFNKSDDKSCADIIKAWLESEVEENGC